MLLPDTFESHIDFTSLWSACETPGYQIPSRNPRNQWHEPCWFNQSEVVRNLSMGNVVWHTVPPLVMCKISWLVDQWKALREDGSVFPMRCRATGQQHCIEVSSPVTCEAQIR
eukprot:symbB.v1.2.024557.t1/scaffold2333.1/size82048/4